MRRTTDIVFVTPKVAVDVRGCFWHGCLLHPRRGSINEAWWAQKVQTNVRRDAETTRLLEESGWEVVVVWEHENVEAAAKRVEAVIRSRAARGTDQT